MSIEKVAVLAQLALLQPVAFIDSMGGSCSFNFPEADITTMDGTRECHYCSSILHGALAYRFIDLAELDSKAVLLHDHQIHKLSLVRPFPLGA